MLGYILILVVVVPSLAVYEKPGLLNVAQEKGLLETAGPLSIEMQPPGGVEKAPNGMVELGPKAFLRIIVKNDSDQRIKVTVVDMYYQNRPHLFKDGRLVAYRPEISRLIRSKDKDPEFVRIGSTVFLEPYSSTDIEELSLSDWYGPLEPGSYKLTNRHRFEIDGPWTKDSAEFFFKTLTKE